MRKSSIILGAVTITFLFLMPRCGYVSAADSSLVHTISINDATIPDLGLSINQDKSYKQDELEPLEIHVVYGDGDTNTITFAIYFFTSNQAQLDLEKMKNDAPYTEDHEHIRVISRSVETDRYSLIFATHTQSLDSKGGHVELVDDSTEVLITGAVSTSYTDQQVQELFSKIEQKARELLGIGVTREFHGKITGFNIPLKHIKISITNGTTTTNTTTDENGNYSITRSIRSDKHLTLIITYSYLLGETTYFSLHFGEDDPNVVEFRRDFNVSSEDDFDNNSLTLNVMLDQEMPVYYSGDWAKTFASMYVHFTEALEFYKDFLHVDVNYQLPLDIYTFVSNQTGTRYWYNIPGKSYITIDAEKSIHESVYRPMNREYHEFSHYIMHNLYRQWPAPSSGLPVSVEERNHDGYINPSTSDSYVEGFAEFMSAVMFEYEQSGSTIPMVPPSEHDKSIFAALNYQYNTQWDGMELNYAAFAADGHAEERAVAGTLWDLFDDPTDYCNMTPEQAYQLYQQDLPNIRQNYEEAKANHESAVQFWNITGPEAVFPPLKILTLDDIREFIQTHRFDDDNVTTIQLQGVWDIIKNFHNDFTSVYKDFIARYPDQKKAIDEVFIAHGFYTDTDPGNGIYDPHDMYRDENHNGRYDAGEYYVDCPVDGFTYKPGDTVGQVTNYNRLWRQSVQEVPGYFIKVDNKVPFYLVKISFPNAFYLDYVVREWNENGMVYVPVPPQGYYALVTVIPEGVQSSVPLNFSSEVFQHLYNTSVQQGYYVQHDFQITGPIPPLPSMPSGQTVNPGSTPKKTTPGFEVILFLGACLVVCMLLKKQRGYKTK